jgi:replicative DNA helicase
MLAKTPWLRNIKGNWRDVNCPCGSTFHFDGKIDSLFFWERTHLRHMASDTANHEMLSFYPKDMVIFYHSKSGYVVERRKHRKEEIIELHRASAYGTVKLAGV